MSVKNPTLDDVARHAGVSSATVSRYLNSPSVVAEKTGKKIREAIDATGYIPNALAGELASRRSRTVAVLIPHIENSLFNDTIESMVNEMTASGYNVMLGLTGTSVIRTQNIMRAAIARRVDAIVITGPLGAEIQALAARANCLFIQIWELPDKPTGLAIGFSHKDAGADIARFLETRGYRRPHLVTPDSPRARDRTNGFIEEWRKRSDFQPTETIVDMPSRFGQARKVFGDLRCLESMPDVVVCGSDSLALGMIVEAQSGGLRVPEDLAVMGFGNSTIAGEMRPSISTIDIDGARIAREVMAAISRHQAGEKISPSKIDVGFRLIPRESV